MRFPDMPGLSVQNLWRMRQFYLAYRDEPNLSPLVREISWSNHLLILGHKAKTLAPTHVAAYRTQLPDEQSIKQRLRALPLPSEL